MGYNLPAAAGRGAVVIFAEFMKPIRSIDALDDALSLPTPGVMDALRAAPGDVLVLGAGGKLGPTLARMARRALDEIGATSRRVMAVSRFSNPRASASLRQAGVETLECDLSNRAAIAALPDCPNVLYLVGQKFGTRESPEQTWFTNTIVPALIAERFSSSRLVVVSTGCVYPFMDIDGPGAAEDDPLGPPGEYANSCVGRERVFEHYAKTNQTPMTIVRLCYAIDLRYGVLLDLAQRIWRQQPIDVGMGATHVIWQGDANARVIQSLARASVPPAIVNVTGRERLRIRALATRLGELLHRDVHFVGQEAPTAWVWNAERSYDWFGPPAVSVEDMLGATAEWIRQGGETLDRPTHFEARDGQF